MSSSFLSGEECEFLLKERVSKLFLSESFKLKIGETVIKLREERNLYGRFLSLMEYRPGVSGTAWLRTTVAFPAWSWLYIRTELPQPGPRWSTL